MFDAVAKPLGEKQKGKTRYPFTSVKATCINDGVILIADIKRENPPAQGCPSAKLGR